MNAVTASLTPATTASAVLLLPGLMGTLPPALAAWAAQGKTHNVTRHVQVVEQHDWLRPLRGDWLMQLENAVLAARGEVLLVAHGLACWLVASWAQVTQHAASVQGVLLIDPLDLSTPELQAQLPSWQRIPLQPLPFAALLVETTQGHSHDKQHAMRLAQGWRARYLVSASTICGDISHDNAHDISHDIAQLAALCDTLKEETHGH
jgi:predicted alpha/beta hydrolase family esterase